MSDYMVAIEKLADLNPFIEYLEKTTDDEWHVDTVRDKGNNKNCVMGHLVNWYYGKDHEGSISAVWDAFEERWATTYMIYPVNDGNPPEWMNHKYNQETPKQRVLAYLRNLRDHKEFTVNELMEQEAAKRASVLEEK